MSTAVYDSVYWSIMDKAEEEIRGLRLSGLEQRIHKQMVLEPKSLPGIYLTIEGVQEEPRGGLNSADDWAYPINLLIVDRSDLSYDKNLAMYLHWRQKIRRHFNNRGNAIFATVSGAYNSEIRPGAVATNVIVERPSAYQLIVSRLILVVFAREGRG